MKESVLAWITPLKKTLLCWFLLIDIFLGITIKGTLCTIPNPQPELLMT